MLLLAFGIKSHIQVFGALFKLVNGNVKPCPTIAVNENSQTPANEVSNHLVVMIDDDSAHIGNTD